MLPTFQWTTFDVTGILPARWQQDVRDAAAEADVRAFPRTPVISREAADVRLHPPGAGCMPASWPATFRGFACFTVLSSGNLPNAPSAARSPRRVMTVRSRPERVSGDADAFRVSR